MMWFLQEKKEIQEFILHKPMMKSKSAFEKEINFNKIITNSTNYSFIINQM